MNKMRLPFYLGLGIIRDVI